MPQAPGEGIEALRERIAAGERDVSDADAELLLRFSNELALRREEYSDHRHLKLLRHCTRMAEHAGALHDAVEEKAAAKRVVRWIHSEYDNEETNRDYRIALRMCGKHGTDGEELPDAVAWISTETSRDYNPTPNPAEMLRWDADVEPMLEAARNPRDAAAIALQMDAGLRGGELYDLRVGDLTDAEHSIKVWADGKRGERGVDLIPSIPHVQRWLDAHPAGDADDYLWTHLRRPDRLSYQSFLEMFKAPARRADIDKPVTPTAFRKSNASWLAREGANEALIEDRQGRVRGSDAVSRYVAAFGEDDAATQYAALNGLDVGTGDEETVAPPVACPRCGNRTPADREFCMHCGQTTDAEALELLDELSEKIDTFAVTADDPEEAAAALELRRELRDQPASVGTDRLHELLSRFE